VADLGRLLGGQLTIQEPLELSFIHGGRQIIGGKLPIPPQNLRERSIQILWIRERMVLAQ
jgi:hypothetical protein